MISSPPKILVIKSDISELKNVEIFVNELFLENNISLKFFNKVFLCISEAVVNSIEHGNKHDLNKDVLISADCESKKVTVQIKDEGEGFNLSEVKDPTKDENLKKNSGRGIHIIKSVADKIEYNEKGNSIQLKIECK